MALSRRMHLCSRLGFLRRPFHFTNIILPETVGQYLFYFNRLFAAVVAFALRIYLWKSTNTYLEIGSLQISLLGGRILFKDVRYESRNMSVRILDGHVTWRYWLWRVRASDDLRKDDSSRPCRIIAQVEGVECFLYNRTASYDAILEKFGFAQRRPPSHAASEKESTFTKIRSRSDTVPSTPLSLNEKKEGIDWLLEALPIDIIVNTGSIVLGNSATPMLIICGFSKASATYGAVESRSHLDSYKQILQAHFTKPKIVFRSNLDYVQPISTFGEQVIQRLSEEKCVLPIYSDQ